MTLNDPLLACLGPIGAPGASIATCNLKLRKSQAPTLMQLPTPSLRAGAAEYDPHEDRSQPPPSAFSEAAPGPESEFEDSCDSSEDGKVRKSRAARVTVRASSKTLLSGTKFTRWNWASPARGRRWLLTPAFECPELVMAGFERAYMKARLPGLWGVRCLRRPLGTLLRQVRQREKVRIDWMTEWRTCKDWLKKQTLAQGWVSADFSFSVPIFLWNRFPKKTHPIHTSLGNVIIRKKTNIIQSLSLFPHPASRKKKKKLQKANGQRLDTAVGIATFTSATVRILNNLIQ